MSATVYCIVLVFNFFLGRPLIYDWSLFFLLVWFFLTVSWYMYLFFARFLLSFLVPSVHSSSFSFCTVAQQHYYQISSVTFTDNKKIAYNYSDPGGTLEKLSKLKPLISRNEELYISKEVKDKMLLHQRANHADQKQWPQKITEYACHDLSVWNKRQESHLISQNVFLQSIIYPSEKKKKKYWNKQHFGMR